MKKTKFKLQENFFKPDSMNTESDNDNKIN